MRNLNPLARAPADTRLEHETTRIARERGCDRGFFTVCWGEYERGETCRCKEDARAAIARAKGPAS